MLTSLLVLQNPDNLLFCKTAALHKSVSHAVTGATSNCTGKQGTRQTLPQGNLRGEQAGEESMDDNDDAPIGGLADTVLGLNRKIFLTHRRLFDCQQVYPERGKRLVD